MKSKCLKGFQSPLGEILSCKISDLYLPHHGMNDLICRVGNYLCSILKELLDVGVKNDDNLLKLATVIQRIMNKQADVTEETSLLSDDEKEELMNALEDMSGDLQKKSDELSKDVTKLRPKGN